MRLVSTGVRRTSARTLVLALVAGSCVDAPGAVTEPASVFDSAPLAQTFDVLSRESAMLGDLSRSEGYAFAAISVRSGVAPSRVDISVDGVLTSFDAFVNVVEWETTLSAAARPPSRSSMVAWRRMGDGALRVVSLHTPGDSAPILSPLSLGPAMSSQAVFAGASAMYQDIAPRSLSTSAVSSTWVATAGYVRIAESQGATAGGRTPCERVESASGIRGVTCENGRYAVRFQSQVQRSLGRPWELSTSGNGWRLGMAEQVVSGHRLRLSCVAPTSTRGCG